MHDVYTTLVAEMLRYRGAKLLRTSCQSAPMHRWLSDGMGQAEESAATRVAIAWPGKEKPQLY